MPSRKVEQQIARLTEEIEYWKGKAFEAADGEKNTDTFVDRYDEGQRGLPKGTRIAFRVKGGLLTARVRDGVLEIHASDYGYANMAVLPEVSNAISVRIVGRDK